MHVLISVNGVVLLDLCQHTVALAYGCAYSLYWLLSSPVLNQQVLVMPRPCLFFKISGLKEAFVQKD